MRFLPPAEFVRSNAALTRNWTPEESLEYTRWLATTHYENFHVVSVLLPRRLHQDFYNVYSFCRWSDDLGDEIPDKEEALHLLGWWNELLERMLAGEAWHPVYRALATTVEKHSLEPEPFRDLIRAFVHDQTVSRYADWSEVHAYCRCSANPVGRLVLALCGYRDEERRRLSDATCTALQLANFWQDISVDLRKDRVYIPQHLIERQGYSVAELFAGVENDAFRAVMRDAVEHARRLFYEGLPLVGMVDKRLAIDLDLFSRGGLRVLDRITDMQFNVLHHRPVVSKVERVGLLLSSALRQLFRSAA
ncbi:MAG TPA: squalene synthase HpnC [Bryobacteraceae bacterium]|nr:squalene synthase HpnC [Bryobacteraceae bacterium]